MYSKETLETIARVLELEAKGESAPQSLQEKFDAAQKIIFRWAHREQYLQWVGEWKDCYKEHSAESHKLKDRRSIYHPEHDYQAATKVQHLRRIAQALLWIREEGKQRSWNQKQLARAAAAEKATS
jgi:hypothetical protein